MSTKHEVDGFLVGRSFRSYFTNKCCGEEDSLSCSKLLDFSDLKISHETLHVASNARAKKLVVCGYYKSHLCFWVYA
jgi:hypothetical protein